jgi:CheY-like chemotaxis protein
MNVGPLQRGQRIDLMLRALAVPGANSNRPSEMLAATLPQCMQLIEPKRQVSVIMWSCLPGFRCHGTVAAVSLFSAAVLQSNANFTRKLTRTQGVTRADRAYVHLKTAIEQGQYPEGSPLPTQPALAKSIGVSTVTLRQALERLAEEGIVEAQHGRGTFVRSRHAVKGTVLVADDDESIRNLLVDSLAQLGYEAVVVGSGEEAVESVARQRFSHVLLDVRMAGLGGVAAGELIARVDPRAVVVFVTAYPADLFTDQQLNPGPALILRKPFDLSEIERVLQLKVH